MDEPVAYIVRNTERPNGRGILVWADQVSSYQRTGLTQQPIYAGPPLSKVVETAMSTPSQTDDIELLRKALSFYATGEHFSLSDKSAWDTVSGEPQNWWCDEAGTATVEDGSVAEAALAGVWLLDDEDEAIGEQSK